MPFKDKMFKDRFESMKEEDAKFQKKMKVVTVVGIIAVVILVTVMALLFVKIMKDAKGIATNLEEIWNASEEKYSKPVISSIDCHHNVICYESNLSVDCTYIDRIIKECVGG